MSDNYFVIGNLTYITFFFSEPSSPDLNIEWPKFTEGSKSFLIIDKEASIASNYEPQRMAVFEEIYEKYEK